MNGKHEVGGGGRSKASAADRAQPYRLATYGTLVPGRPNHHQLHGLEGRWSREHVRGTLVDASRGAGLGCSALVLDPNGPVVEVDVVESVDLRRTGPVSTSSRDPAAHITFQGGVMPVAGPDSDGYAVIVDDQR